MNLYRYEFEDGIGIICGSDRLVITEEDDNDMIDAISVFDRDLPIPDMDCFSYMHDTKYRTRSYFTEHGNNKFQEPIALLLEIAKRNDIKINQFIISDNLLSPDNLLYRDLFQVLYKILD